MKYRARRTALSTALAAALCLTAGCARPEKQGSFTISSVQTAGSRTAGTVELADDGTVDLDSIVREIKILAQREATVRQRSLARERAAQVVRKSRPRTDRKRPRYLVVETARDERSVGDQSVMLWDTFANDVVGNNVFDIRSAPVSGSLVKFETFSAEYVGSGI